MAMIEFAFQLILLVVAALAGAVGFWYLARRLRKEVKSEVVTHCITERVRSVGKLVGLEVMTKEIVTQTKGLGWLPPLLLSQARLAMIFSFEKQYFIDLATLDEGAVQYLGGDRYRLTLPPIEGQWRLQDVVPYDIQSGKLLGLLDVFRMDAQTQKTLMERAQEEAKGLYDAQAAKYEAEARRAIAIQIQSLIALFEINIEVSFAQPAIADAQTPRHVPPVRPADLPAMATVSPRRIGLAAAV